MSVHLDEPELSLVAQTGASKTYFLAGEQLPHVRRLACAGIQSVNGLQEAG